MPDLEGRINIDADFSKADKKLQDFVKAMENQATYKKSTVQKMTQPFLKSRFEKFLAQKNLPYGNLESRVLSYITAKAKQGAFGEEYASKTKKEKASFLAQQAALFTSQILQDEKNQKKIEKIQKKRQQELAKRIMNEEAWNKKMEKLHILALKENKAFDENKKKQVLKAQQLEEKEKEKNRRKLFNALFMKWGKLGIAGLIAGQAIKYIVKGASALNQVAQTSLGQQMTIEGGASGGAFFGQSLAAMQRAGISAKEYGTWKRGMMGKVGAIKLGMGNAAPFMSLGVSVLDNLDNMELEIEKRLQKLPSETSWALGSQLGMSYELWERMYQGKIDRSKPGYDKDAIEAWAKAAENINELTTYLKTFFINFFGKPAEMITSASTWKQGISQAYQAATYPYGSYGLGRLAVDINLKKNGTIMIDTKAIENQNVDTFVEIGE